MKYIYFPIIALLIFYSTASPAEEYIMFGMSGVSCSTWLSNQVAERDGLNWILGYWSGLNSKNSDSRVGENTDGMGIIGEVKKCCINQPSETMPNAIEAVYKKMEEQIK